MKAIQMARQKTGLKKRSKTNGKTAIKLIAAFTVFLIIGCATTDVVYVPPGDAVKLRETVKGVKVWIKTTEKITLPGKTDLMNGWY